MPETAAEILRKACPRFDESGRAYMERIDKAAAGHKAVFGRKNVRVFTAPGRTEIGGNHTDHQHGCVLAAAVDLDIIAAAAENGTDKIRVKSEGYDLFEVDTARLEAVAGERNTAAAIARGVAAGIARKGFGVKGIDIYALSSVPKGGGLSSSAAFETVLAAAMNAVFCEERLSAMEIAKIGRAAENEYFGKPSGLMDQAASSLGGIVAIDFADENNPKAEKLNASFAAAGHALCIIDTGADHAGLTAEYAAIPREMEAVAGIFGKKFLRELCLEELTENAAKIRQRCGDRAFLRSVHFMDENLRAQREALFLRENNIEGFLSEVRESGYSSFMYLQNVTQGGQSQPLAFALCLCHSLLCGRGAFRVHGGGFAGTVQAFVPLDFVEEFKIKIEKSLGSGRCQVLAVREMGGGEIVLG